MLRSERLKNIELLILNRPDAGNSISSELTTALLEKLERLKSDNDLHALITVSYTHLTLPTIFRV